MVLGKIHIGLRYTESVVLLKLSNWGVLSSENAGGFSVAVLSLIQSSLLWDTHTLLHACILMY